ncbi:MAG: tetratricopeptide repeat protein [Candidatus Obscuribacterales bacterium]|nr:tetratricopeptide repeat protein [Candidatus Obscuribacterales bacterium]
MASSEKPDFIDSKEKDAPVELTTEGSCSEDLQNCTAESSSAPAPVGDSQRKEQGDEAPSMAVAPQPIATSSFKPRVQSQDDFPSLPDRQKSPGKKMRRLPGGSLLFIGLLSAVCFFGNQIDEMRNRTLVDVAKQISPGGRGYVETVGDLGESLLRHKDPDGAKTVYAKAMGALGEKGLDSGAKGAFLRLRLAEVDFYNANSLAQAGRRSKGSARRAAFDESWRFEKDAQTSAAGALRMLASDSSGVTTELPFLLSDVAHQFEDWFDYDMAIKLNETALSHWPRRWRNGRAYVDGALGWEYLLAGKPASAEEHLKNSLGWTMRNGSVTNTNAWHLSILGRSQIDLKKYMDAEVNLSHALEMWDELKNSEGDLSIEYARIYTDQGRIKAALGDNNEALKLFEKAEAILKKNRHRTFDTLRNHYAMANFYRDIGQYSKAGELYSAVIGRIDDGKEGPNRAAIMKDWELLRRMSGGR